jgi:hypothetical protein
VRERKNLTPKKIVRLKFAKMSQLSLPVQNQTNVLMKAIRITSKVKRILRNFESCTASESSSLLLYYRPSLTGRVVASVPVVRSRVHLQQVSIFPFFPLIFRSLIRQRDYHLAGELRTMSKVSLRWYFTSRKGLAGKSGFQERRLSSLSLLSFPQRAPFLKS